MVSAALLPTDLKARGKPVPWYGARLTARRRGWGALPGPSRRTVAGARAGLPLGGMDAAESHR